MKQIYSYKLLVTSYKSYCIYKQTINVVIN